MWWCFIDVFYQPRRHYIQWLVFPTSNIFQKMIRSVAPAAVCPGGGVARWGKKRLGGEEIYVYQT